MRLLVTGGCGFIGSNFIHYWIKKHPQDFVINLDKLTYAGNVNNLKDLENHPRYLFIKGDIVNPQEVEKVFKKGIDVVVNMAAESHVDRSIYEPLEFVKTNILGTAILLEAARKHGIKKFIQVSTDEVYGSLSLEGEEKFTPEAKYQPRSPYAASKASSDHLVYSYWATYAMPTIITNCSNNVGPYQYPEKFIPLSITNVLERKPIRVYGKGKNRRDWIHVLDHVLGIEAAIKRGKVGQTYLFGGKDGAKFNNLQVAKMILKKMNQAVRIRHEGVKTKGKNNEATIHLVPDRPGHDLRYDVDWSRSKKELGWEPQLGMEQILDETIKWYQENQWWWKSLKKVGVVIKHG